MARCFNMETGGTGDILFSYDTADGMRVYRSRAGREEVQKPNVLEAHRGVENAEIVKLENEYPVVIFQSYHDRRVCIRSKEAQPRAFGTIQKEDGVRMGYLFYDDTKAQADYEKIVRLYENGYVFDHSEKDTVNGRFGRRISAETLVFVTRDKTKPRLWGDTIVRFFTGSQLTIPLETLHRIDRLLADC